MIKKFIKDLVLEDRIKSRNDENLEEFIQLING
jgi:hypothetical protein